MFHKQIMVKKFFVKERINAIVNRLNKTRTENTNPDLAGEKLAKQQADRAAQRKVEKMLRQEEMQKNQELKQVAELKSYKSIYDDVTKMKTNKEQDDDDFM